MDYFRLFYLLFVNNLIKDQSRGVIIMNFKLILTICLLIEIPFSVGVVGLKCYVCGNDGEFSCNDFELEKDVYIKECTPPSNQGCAKRTNVTMVIRECSIHRFDDCEAANGVEYCYCLTDLCNSNISELVGPPDDEDSIEGSGIKVTSTAAEKPITTIGKSWGGKVNMYSFLLCIPFTLLLNK
ncbi:hypothetical protein NQ315_010421 [Exocentrus adspersus]|uniref:Uncharacterized protein n=1 Tax=Exocentrus adspersus TaxID=1586481 RepID=A0AAV8WBC5_9CUCU|nr:hypothetical protein NQ315_010421 [Exocentrus adspersus]